MLHKVVVLIFTVLCLSALVTNGVQKGRVYPEPTCFLRAGKFLDLGEFERTSYTTGLLDGFYASAIFGAADDTVESLNSCTKGMDSKQITAIISKYVTDHPETWHLPLSLDAYNAFNQACPVVLKYK